MSTNDVTFIKPTGYTVIMFWQSILSIYIVLNSYNYLENFIHLAFVLSSFSE